MIYIIITTTKQRRERLQKCIDAIRLSTIPHSIVLYENSDGGCVLALRKAISGIDAPVFILNDDMIVEPDCLRTLYDEYLKDPSCVYQPYEGIHEGKLAVSPFCHSSTIKPYFEKGYIHSFWDTELTIMSMAFNKYRIINTAKLDHQHVIRDPSLQDETYKISQDSLAVDTLLFNQRKLKQFND